VMQTSRAWEALVRGLRGSRRAGAFCALLSALLAPAAPALAQVPTSIIESRATVTWRDENGGSLSAETSVSIGLDGATSLLVQKAVDRTTAQLGDTLRYTITWTNTGTASIAGLVVSDTLSHTLSLLPGSVTAAAGVTAGVTGSILTVSIDDLPSGATGSVSFRAIVHKETALVENLAHATFATTGGPQQVSSDTARTLVSSEMPRVRLWKSVDLAEAAVGDTVTYTFGWFNEGPGRAMNAHLVDRFPPQLEMLAGTARSSHELYPYVDRNGLMRLPLGTLAAEDSGWISIAGRVISAGSDGTTAVAHNVAELEAGTSSVFTFHSDTVRTVLYPGRGRLNLLKSASADSVALGDTLRYTIRWENSGAWAAANAVIADALPVGVEFVPGSVETPAGVVAAVRGRTVEFALGEVPAGGSGSLSFAVRTTQPVSAENIATVTWTSVARGGSAASNGVRTAAEGLADIRLEKSVDRRMAELGDTVSYTIRWWNRGNGPARFLELADSIPAGLSLLPASVALSAGEVLAADARRLAIALGTAAPADSGTIRFQAVVTDGPMTALNVARAGFSSQGQPRTAESDTARTELRGAAGVILRKSVSLPAAAPGDTLHYTMRWRNGGSGTAWSVTVADTLPTGVALVPGTLAATAGALATYADGVVTVDVGTLAAADSGSVRFAAVVEVSTGVIRNVGSARYVTGGSARQAESEVVSTRVDVPDLVLSLEALVDRPLHVGDTLTYRVVLRNPSPDIILRNVIVVDSLPRELEFTGSQPEPSAFAPGLQVAGAVMLPAAAAGAGSPLPQQQLLGGTVTWLFPTLAPGESHEILVRTVVRGIGGGEIINVVSGVGAGLRQAVAAVAAVVSEEREALALRKVASSMEAAVGDAVGFTITVRNTGSVALDSVVVSDRAAAGLRLHRDGVRGATILPGNEADGTLRFWVGGLAAGAEAVIQYGATVTGSRGQLLGNTAWAVAGGAVRSDTATAAVRVRDAVMTTRVVMGRVWLDENGDGRQGREERPLAHAVVWTTAGETVRADSLGRFTFPDLAPGRYTFRVDPLSVPAGYDNIAPVTVRVDGWTSPVVSFALPKSARAVAAEQDRSMSAAFLLQGTEFAPRPRFSAPRDGYVTGVNRLFARVEGEPMADVTLLHNDSVIARTTLRPDGSQDFLGIELQPGAHVLEAVVHGAGGDQRTRVNVHHSGFPARVERADSATLRAGRTSVVALRVVDEWGVPVAQQPWATVSARGMNLLDGDVDPGSVGLQLPVTEDGLLLVRVRTDSAGVGRLAVSFAGAPTDFDVHFMPELRSLVLVADGEIGTGATTESYGSAVARGMVGEHTAVTLSYDSRRRRDGAFNGVFDPLGEGRYVVQGDASERRVLTGVTTPLSLKLERDRGWLLVGDVDTRAFGGDDSPASYRRALPGVSAQWNNGLFAISGFGSQVSQQLVQTQVRGNGTSGPYQLGGAIRLGTDRLAIEVRDRMNASLVISREELERFVDYDIDDVSGTVLLRRPLPSTDPSGNAIFLVALAEQIHGEAALVGGLSARMAAAAPVAGVDSVRIGAGYVEDQSALGAHRIMNADVAAMTQWGGSRVEVARGENADSAGVAFQASAWLGSRDGGTGVKLDWMRVGEGFTNPANPRALSGTEDLRVAGRLGLTEAWGLGGSYSRQWFRARGAEREQGTITLARTAGKLRAGLDVGVLNEEVTRDTALLSWTSLRSRLTLGTARSSSWVEATQQLGGDGGPRRPSVYGVGTAYEVGLGVRLEASQRLVVSDTVTDAITTVGLRRSFATGTRVWSEYQLGSSESGSRSAALVGIGQKWQVSEVWSVDGQFERRAGLNRLPETDPERALPFSELEQDRWAAGAGVEWKPRHNLARAALRGELGSSEAMGRTYRVFGSAEAALNPSVTLLLRHDAHESQRVQADGTFRSATARSILGAAYRPSARSDWNMLAKLEYRSDENPQRLSSSLLRGTDRRFIAAMEAVWTPDTRSEVGVRYALRHGEMGGLLAGGNLVTTDAHYAGARVRRELHRRLDVRTSARLLAEQHSGLLRWDVSPALGVLLVQGLDVEAGYRFGDLQDVDFAARGGRGFYATLGIRVTEETGRDIAGFWRQRMGGGR
jgi:uncharacterized repeat protein (TIGR01451 family)